VDIRLLAVLIDYSKTWSVCDVFIVILRGTVSRFSKWCAVRAEHKHINIVAPVMSSTSLKRLLSI